MAKWRCTVCDYIHEGPEPPETCPVCGVDASFFVKVEEAPDNECQDAIKKALRHITYGLYVVASRQGEKINGQCANTVFQITSSPVTIAMGINKNNLTHQYIEDSQVFSVSILSSSGLELVRNFGFRSGRDADKFDGIDYDMGALGVPLLKNCLAALECTVVGSMDLGTHTLFIGKVTCARAGDAGQSMTRSGSVGEPMTYAMYHRIKNNPPKQAAPEEVTRWRCKVCGYIHEGEEPPEVCPVCGVGPEEFEKI